MPTYYTILTDAGQVLLAEAISSGVPVVLTQFAVGDGNGAPVTPDASMTALVNEVYRSSISSLSTNPEQPNAMVAQLIIPKESAGYTIREVAVFTEDGTMFSIGNYADQPKPPIDSGYAVKVDIRYVLVVSDTSAITVVIEPGDYLTQEEADGRYVNKTGDEITGPLVVTGPTTTNGDFIRQNPNYPFGATEFATLTNEYDNTGFKRWAYGAYQTSWCVFSYDAAGAYIAQCLMLSNDGSGGIVSGSLAATQDLSADRNVAAANQVRGNEVVSLSSVYSGNGAAALLADGNVSGPAYVGGNVIQHMYNVLPNDIQYGAEVYFPRSAPDWIFRAGQGSAITGLDIAPSNNADSINGICTKPTQKSMTGVWITING